MRLQSFLRRPNTWRTGLILLAIMASLVAGAFGLVWDSPLAPLVVGGTCVAAAFGIVCLQQKPIWALYAVIFIQFLPRGLIPDNLHAILSHLALLLALLSWLLEVSFQRRPIVWTSTSLLMTCCLIWSFFTLSWSSHLVQGRRELVQFTLNLVPYLILIVNEVNSLQALDGLMNTLALNGWVLVLTGIGTVLLQGYTFGTRLKILEMEENALGMLLITTAPGVLWHAMRSSERQRALRMSLSFIFIVLTLILTALTGSRASAISWLATLLAFWFWKATRPWGKLGLLILAVTVISAPFVFSTLVDRFLEGLKGSVTVTGGRLEIWQAAMLVIRDHPWWGVGMGSGRYILPSYLHARTNLFWFRRQQLPPHNPILAVWMDTGLPGVLLYLSALGSAIWPFVRQYFHLGRTGGRCLASYFALVSCTFVGYMLSWINGGGVRFYIAYLMMLALLLIPSRLDFNEVDCVRKNTVQDVGTSEP